MPYLASGVKMNKRQGYTELIAEGRTVTAMFGEMTPIGNLTHRLASALEAVTAERDALPYPADWARVRTHWKKLRKDTETGGFWQNLVDDLCKERDELKAERDALRAQIADEIKAERLDVDYDAIGADAYGYGLRRAEEIVRKGRKTGGNAS